jgi:hypothetical protein
MLLTVVVITVVLAVAVYGISKAEYSDGFTSLDAVFLVIVLAAVYVVVCAPLATIAVLKLLERDNTDDIDLENEPLQ